MNGRTIKRSLGRPRMGPEARPGTRRDRALRRPVRDFLDAHEASIDAAVMRVRTDPEARDAVRRYVERALGARA